MDATTVATQMNIPSFQPQILPDRAIIRVGGDGALAFLHNLLTMELSEPKPAYGALLTPQGKILHDVFVVPDGNHIWIDVARVQAADLLKRLIMYRLRAKLDIALDDGKAVAVSASGDLPGIAFVDPRVPEIGYRGIVDVASLPVGTGYNAARIGLGLADSEQEIGSGQMFVHEANLDQLHGVSFSKGCYVGQEVVSRTHHRHTARNRILPLSFDGEVHHGADVVSGEVRLGTMLSSVEGRGLALLRLDRLAEASAPLLTSGVKLSVHKPSWANFEVVIPQ
jgi:tRNA-modifying protein YgfZ